MPAVTCESAGWIFRGELLDFDGMTHENGHMGQPPTQLPELLTADETSRYLRLDVDARDSAERLSKGLP
jgi:hypothetical protein